MQWKEVFLYFTSSATQVWAALLVFGVLIIRDSRRDFENRLESIWNQTKGWWGDFPHTCEENKVPKEVLEKFAKVCHLLRASPVDRNSFIELMIKLKVENLIEESNLNILIQDSLATTLKGKALQERFNNVTKKIEQIQKSLAPLSEMCIYKVGIIGIIFNFLMLVLGPRCFAYQACFSFLSLILLFGFNAILGSLFVHKSVLLLRREDNAE